MSIRALFSLLVAPAVLAACSLNNDVHPPMKPGLTAPQSFTVTGQLALSPGPNAGVSSETVQTMTVQFMLRVDPTGRLSVIGGRGEAIHVPFASDDGFAFRLINPLSMGLDAGNCGSGATYSDFQFTAGPDALAGSATGTAFIAYGDYGNSYTARLDFTGVPDVTGPSLYGTRENVDPLAPLFLTTSEPLPAGQTALLATSDEKVKLDPVTSVEEGEVYGFAHTGDALRYGTTYQVVVDPWTDLAGNSGAAVSDLTTWTLPPLADQDGFEGSATELGGAAIVDGTVLSPIDGDKSAVLGPLVVGVPNAGGGSPRMTVRLAVKPGAHSLHLSIRQFSTYSLSGGTFSPSLRLAVPGGPIAGIAVPDGGPLSPQQMLPLPNQYTIYMGTTVQVEAPLPAGVTDEVILDFNVDPFSPYASCGPARAPIGYQIDDLRVE